MEQTTGKRLSELRKAKGLSVEEFAAKLGVKPSAVYGLQSDANKPSFDTLSSILQHFPDVSLDWLLTGAGPMLRDGRVLTPIEAPATKAAPVVQAPVATAPAAADSELLKEIRDSRDQARREASKAWKDAEYWRNLYLAEVKRYLNVEDPHEDQAPEESAEPALPGKVEVDEFAAEINPMTGTRKAGFKYGTMATDHAILTEEGELLPRFLTTREESLFIHPETSDAAAA